MLLFRRFFGLSEAELLALQEKILTDDRLSPFPNHLAYPRYSLFSSHAFYPVKSSPANGALVNVAAPDLELPDDHPPEDLALIVILPCQGDPYLAYVQTSICQLKRAFYCGLAIHSCPLSQIRNSRCLPQGLTKKRPGRRRAPPHQ